MTLNPFHIWQRQLGTLYFTFEGQEYKLNCSEMEIIEFAKVDAPCEVRDVELFFNGTIAAPDIVYTFLIGERKNWIEFDLVD